MALIEMSAAVGALILHAASTRSVEPAQLAAAAGFDLTLAQDPDARISLVQEERLWDAAEQLSGDVTIGLQAAKVMQPGTFDVLDYAVRTAPNLRVAFDRLTRYNRLIHDVAVFSVHEHAGVLRIEHSFGSGRGTQCRHSAEFTLAAVIVFGAQMTHRPLRPRAVAFRHGSPTGEALGELTRFFGVEPRFAQPVNALELDAAVLSHPVPDADPRLWRVIERHAETLLSRAPEPTLTIGDRVRRVLARALSTGEATLTNVARALRMSERSLQRKLAREQLSFDVLLDQLRHELALRYLQDPKIAIAEVAYLLGYSEPSPFHRAFKRWTGVTPSEARQRAGAAARPAGMDLQAR